MVVVAKSHGKTEQIMLWTGLENYNKKFINIKVPSVHFMKSSQDYFLLTKFRGKFSMRFKLKCLLKSNVWLYVNLGEPSLTEDTFGPEDF